MRKVTRFILIFAGLHLLSVPVSAQQKWKYLITAQSDRREVKVYYRRPLRYRNDITRVQIRLVSSDAVSTLVAEFDCRTEQYRTIQKTVMRKNEKRVYTKPQGWEAIPLEDFRAPLFREICGKPIGSSD